MSTVDSEADRALAVRRFLDHNVHTAWAAAMMIRTQRDPIHLDTPVPGVVPEEMSDPAQAIAWFTAERPVLMSVVTQAVESGADVHTWQLATALSDFLTRQSHLDDNTTLQTAAEEAALARKTWQRALTVVRESAGSVVFEQLKIRLRGEQAESA